MSTFKVNLVSPEQLLFSDQVDQVDLPGLEGDFGVLAGHAPIVAALRPGIVVILRDANTRQRFVVLGGLAEFSKEELTILADTASTVEEFDLTDLMARIDKMQDNLKTSIGEELDRAIEQLDHYKSLHKSLTLTTAF